MKKSLILFLLSFNYTQAQLDSLATVNLKEVTVRSLKQKTIIERFPAAISLKKVPEVWQGPQLSLQEYLTNIPGIISFNASNYAQDLRLSIRGFGARSAFGIRGIKIIIDGIPETTPDGQGQLDNLPLGILSSIELLRGPNSLRFGNAAGGVLNLQTLDSINESSYRIDLGGSRYGHKQFQMTLSNKIDKTAYIIHSSHISGYGYRDNSRYQTNLINLKINRRMTQKTKLTAQLNATHSPYAEDAGGQTLNEYRHQAHTARDRNIQYQAGEKISHYKAAVGLDFESDRFEINSYGFISNRLFSGKLPFSFGGWVDLNRHYHGQGTELSFIQEKNKLKWITKLGYNLLFQNDQRSRYVNDGGEQGSPTLNQQESFKSYGGYLIHHLTYKKWTLNGGIRWDQNELSVEDYDLTNGNGTDKESMRQWSPQIGISYQFNTSLYGFINQSKSYETPTLSELSADPNGSGGFNELLKVQVANNFELGLNFIKKKTRFNLVYFYIRSENDLVPYELAETPGRTYYNNTGSTLRNGIEFDFHQQFTQNFGLNLTLSTANYTYSKFIKNGSSLNGNSLPGVPKIFGAIDLHYRLNNNWEIYWNRTHRGSLYADDENTTKVHGFWTDQIALHLPLDLFGKNNRLILGCINLFNIRHSDNIRINAFGNRFYEAAPEQRIYTKLQLYF